MRGGGPHGGVAKSQGNEQARWPVPAGFRFRSRSWTRYVRPPETDDRILSTQMEAQWAFSGREVDSALVNAMALAAILEVFAESFSPSVQNRLYLAASAALEAAPEITEVSLAMPDKHYLPVNFQPFGQQNEKEIYLPTDEPHGQIEARVRRSPTQTTRL